MKPSLSPGRREEILAAIAACTGLHFPPDRWPEVERGLRAAAAELRAANEAEMEESILAAVPDTRCAEVLARHLTVGETYFLRDPATFEILRDQILAPLIRQRREDGLRHLRLWSAGCCTGEEAYSLAIIVSWLLPDLDDWSVSILATDINRDFLRTAEQGIYKKWSFRGAPDDFQELHFTQLPEERHAILPRYRKMVNFRFLNLAGAGYPSLFSGTEAMDVILCRNVLIYFTPEQCRRVIGRLQTALLPGGWLITGAAEGAMAFEPLVAVTFPGVVVYQNTVPPLPAWAEIALPATPLPDRIEPPPKQPEPAVEELVERSRAQANAGELEEALRLCDLALARDRFNARLHYLRGSILQEGERIGEAVESFRRVVHLDPRFVPAHFAMGTLAGSEGRRREQIGHFETALLLLRALPQDRVLPDSAGITAGRLAEVIVKTMHSSP